MVSPPGKKDSCAVLLAIAGGLIGLGYFLNSLQGWVL